MTKITIDREVLERVLDAMEGVIDVADRKTDEFDALRSCVVDLTVMLFKNSALLEAPSEPEEYEHPDGRYCPYHGFCPDGLCPC